MKVKFKKLHPDAVTPTYAKPGDAGLDLTAIDDGKAVIENNERNERYSYGEYRTGIAVEIPQGCVGLIFPRSSISKTATCLSNCVGVIDSGYRGEILFRFKPDGAAANIDKYGRVPATYVKGDRIGQLVIIPYPQIELEETTDLSDSERGTGGFGSSNN